MKRTKQPTNYYRMTGDAKSTKLMLLRTDLRTEEDELVLDIPLDFLMWLSYWQKRLIAFNGGYGQVTITLKKGRFSDGLGLETYKFTTPKDGDNST